jgi:hypothetical protein
MKTKKTQEKAVVKKRKINLKMMISLAVMTVTMLSLTVMTSATSIDMKQEISDAFSGVDLVAMIIEPILAIIPIALPVMLALAGIITAISMVKRLLRF